MGWLVALFLIWASALVVVGWLGWQIIKGTIWLVLKGIELLNERRA